VRSQVLNQGELPHSAVGQPSFSRLINGYGYCNGVNQLLAFPLSEIFGEVRIFATRYPKTGVSASAAGKSTHVNLLLKVREVEVFADAWSNIPLFKLEDEKRVLADVPLYEEVHAKVPLVFDLPELSSVSNVGTLVNRWESGKIGGLTEASFESLLNASSGGMLRRSAYTNGEVRGSIRNQPFQFARVSLEREIRSQELIKKLIKKYQDDTFMLYLIARVFHIYNEIEQAKLLYNFIRDTDCQMVYCRASQVFSNR
jgi:hypothetical protein